MKILVLAVHYEVTGARYIVDALKRLGHDVLHFGDQDNLKDAWGVHVAQKYFWRSDFGWPVTWTPDLVIIADTDPRTVKKLIIHEDWLSGIPLVVWSNDNHVRNMRHVKANHYFLAHYHGQAQPVTQPDETWLPCATDITVFTPSHIPWEQREYDVCLVGVMYPQRVKLIERLKAEGFKVFAATGLVYDEFQQAYANSRVSLCVSANGDLAQRFFETAAIGCLVLSDLVTDLTDMNTNKQLGLSGFAIYQDEDDLVNRLREFLGAETAMAQGGAKTLQALVRAKHTWEHRAQMVIDWYEKEYGVADIVVDVNKLPKPMLNLGCGKTHFPSAKPAGHELIPDDLYTYPVWLNVDKVEGVGADKTFDLFTYPWPLEDNSFDGAVLAHLVEHIPHEIKTSGFFYAVKQSDWTNTERRFHALSIQAQSLQDGWYAFFSELYRVLTPGAVVHIVSPYGWSDGGITDPSHTRYLTINTFTHSMTPEISDGSTFKYNNGGINFQIDGSPQYRVTPLFGHLMPTVDDLPEVAAAKHRQLEAELQTRLNVCYDFYLRLKAVK